MILREFIYVDVDKVRGLLAQLDEGISESSSDKTHSEKNTGAGLKGLAAHSQKWGSESVVQRSLGDLLFPTLEQALESHGLLADISDQLQDPAYWGEQMRDQYPAGTLVRITAPGTLFDARYVASSLAAFATTFQGLVNVDAVDAPIAKPPVPPKKTASGAQKSQKAPVAVATDVIQIEDALPALDINFGGDTVTREFLQGIIRVSRGVFSPGLHLNLLPTTSTQLFTTARLQEGRQFLDTDPEILYARYGASPQDWTLVGSIGTYGQNAMPDEDEPDLVNADDSVNRAGFAGFVNNFLLKLAGLGFVDLPKEPNFSVVPLAVYRVIGSTHSPATDAYDGPTI